MSITDELREWAEGNTLRAGMSLRTARDQALAIADRIDAAHERTFRNLTDALHKQEDATRELDEKSVLLPVDADGEVIRIGDVMENLREDLEPQLHHTFRVYGILYRDYGQKCALTEDGYPTILYRASECRHYHEPTVEDVLREFVERWHDTHHDDIPALFAEYAARLQLRSDAEVVE